MGDAGDFVRLHITPLDAELAKVVIPASLQPVARNISYHTLETFPERRYGFVDLPEADAEKLRRKLNGTTLKGCKMRVEKARPETRPEPTGAEDADLEVKKKKSKDDKDKSKKRKREPDVLQGVALHDRHVKRGWTEAPTTSKRKNRKDKESKDKDKEKKKKRPSSKYTEGEECLLKTKLPANTIKNLAPDELEQKKRSKKKGSSSRQVVIHEFEKTTKFPSFLKTSTTTDRKAAVEFVEGKGWVDEEGNLVEQVKEKEKKKLPQRPKKAPPPKKASEESEDDDSTSSSGTSSEGTSSEDEEESEAEPEVPSTKRVKKETKKEAAEIPTLTVTKPQVEADQEKNSDTSDDNTSDSDESDDEEEEDAKQKDHSSKATDQTTPPTSSKTPASKSTPASAKPLAIKIPPPETPTTSSKVHPLEALYKRPKPDGNSKTDNKPTSAPKEAEPFSFFGAADDDLEDATSEAAAAAPPANLAPMTPFTRQDFEWRNVRSAAPTPDTAHPSRAARFWGASPDEDVEMEDDVANALREDYYPDEEEEAGEDRGAGDEEEDEGEASGRHSATTDFQKWFWENRRNLNRSWMTRRKTAAKDKRHRENKARASKAV